jgi:hypothetical protein
MMHPVKIAVKPISQPTEGVNGYTGFFPGKVDVFKKGGRRFVADTKALTSDVQLDHDVEATARDGTRIYIDVYRPANATEKVPVILSWSPYGKKYSAMVMLPMTVLHSCVKRSDRIFATLHKEPAMSLMAHSLPLREYATSWSTRIYGSICRHASIWVLALHMKFSTLHFMVNLRGTKVAKLD